MNYKISSEKPHTRYINIELKVENIHEDETTFLLASWRPGRYELGNFAKNIQLLEAFNDKNEKINIRKTSKDSWSCDTKDVSTVIIRYNYFAAQPDAGGCWVNENLIYINPVHCCLYIEDRINLPCKIHLDIPSGWKIECGLILKGNNILQATDFHNLADSPFFASSIINKQTYISGNSTFNICMAGNCNPDWNKVTADFKSFTDEQLKMMGGFPFTEYYFLVLVLPYKFYHGVEHTNSTVLAIGPGYSLMNSEMYQDFIGVASHELFHSWNIKTIRPFEMQPYRYQQENYSTLGWVYEGFTTYYGDLLLARSNFFTADDYLKEISMRLQRHMDNYGRFNYSVSESSYDTWLDGYTPGIPNRKTSIYDEGSLIALMLDLYIRINSAWKNSLDDVMRALYKEFGIQQRGYTEKDIYNLAAKYSTTDALELFSKYINSASGYDSNLQILLFEAGCYINTKPAKNIFESAFGFRVISDGNNYKISAIAPGSPAEVAGLSKDDELICVDNIKIENNLNDLLKVKTTDSIKLDVFTMKEKRTLELSKNNIEYYAVYAIEIIDDISTSQKKNFKLWCGLDAD
jgi:predicted metalloprotease with PDZ domain